MFDRVKQNTTTTGTGIYTITGTPPDGYRSFSNASAAYNTRVGTTSFPCPCLVRMGSVYELGYYYFTSPDQLARGFVVSSSNADAAVSWAAGTKTIEIVPIALSMSAIGGRNGYIEGDVNPSVNDDASKGFMPGSTWFSNGVLWLCKGNAVAAASWVSTDQVLRTGAGGYIYALLGVDDDPYPRTDASQSRVFYTDGNVQSSRSTDLVGHELTTDATTFQVPIKISQGTTSIRGTVIARRNSDGAAKLFNLNVQVKKGVSTFPAIFGTTTVAMVAEDASMSATTVAFTVDGATTPLYMEFTGIAATDIRWSWDLRAHEVYIGSGV